MRFRDRADAGRRLAEQLRSFELVAPVVLALPRGGVPVAYEIAGALSAPLDVFVARKVGAPHQAEFGIGAIAEGGGVVADEESVRALGLSASDWDRLVEIERRELHRRVLQYRHGRALPSLDGRDVILVDDGLATGVTAEAALIALRSWRPRRLLLAVPVCAPSSARRLSSVADDVVCVLSPPDFFAVGQWYERFDQTDDQEVLAVLERATATSGR